MSTEFSIRVRNLPSAEVFKEFCDAFSDYIMPTDKSSWQSEIVEIFGNVGRNAGYQILREFLRLDLIWYLDLPGVSFLELAMEHENHTSDLGAILEEVDKLRHVKAHKKLVIYYPRSKAIPRHLEEIAEYALSSKIQQQPQAEWSVLALTDDRDEWKTVEASLHVLGQDTKWTKEGSQKLVVRYA